MAYSGEQKKEYQRQWMLARRAAWLDGKSCVICGSTDNLEIDHINPTLKTRNISTIWSLSPNNPNRVEELAKCQILCHKHHLEKTIKEANENRQHGRTMYAHGCKCEICVEAQHKHNAQRYAP